MAEKIETICQSCGNETKTEDPQGQALCERCVTMVFDSGQLIIPIQI